MQIIQAFQVFCLLEDIDQLLDIVLYDNVRTSSWQITSNLPRSGYVPLLFPAPLPTWPVLLYKTLVPCNPSIQPYSLHQKLELPNIRQRRGLPWELLLRVGHMRVGHHHWRTTHGR